MASASSRMKGSAHVPPRGIGDIWPDRALKERVGWVWMAGRVTVVGGLGSSAWPSDA
jgi:hypothetical protein